MAKRFEARPRQYVEDTLVATVCDGCGAEEDTPGYYYTFIPVAIEVNLGEEYGRRDEYDYCESCVLVVAPKLKAAPAAVASW